MMRVWTLQTIEAWGKLQKNKVLYRSEEKVYKDFIEPYKWIMQQMRKRLNNFSGNYPIWVWVKPKPDLRKNHGFKKGEKGVRLELLLPEDRILISDFDAWHAVLNCWYLHLTDEEEKLFDQELNNYGIKYPLSIEELPDELKQQIMDSWQRIFDIELIKKTEWSYGEYIQGVVDGIYLSDVVKVTEFVGR